MAYETNWLHNRIALGTAALLAGTALAMGGIALAPTGASADDAAPMTVSAADGTVEVSVGGTFNTSSAEGMFGRINDMRSEADATPLSWSTGLEAAAQQRAVECALAGTGAAVSNGEIVAVGSDATALLDAWHSQKDAYAEDEGDPAAAAYANLVSSGFSAIGAASYTAADGTTYVVVEFGTDASATGTVAPDGASATAAVPASSLDCLIDAPISLETGTSGTIYYELSYNGSPAVTSQTPTWTSDNPGVMSVDANGTLSAASEGTATISLTVGGVVMGGVTIEAVSPTAVSAALPDASTSLDVDYGVDPTPLLPQTATVTWSNGATTEEPVAWDAVDPASYTTPGGTFAVEGTAAGLPVSVSVTVGPLYIVDVAQPADVVTEQGVPTELPATVTATMADGSTSEVAVSWEAVDQSAWSSEAGGFDVAGWVEGWDQPVSLHVVLNAPEPEPEPEPEPLPGGESGSSTDLGDAPGDVGGIEGGTQPGGDEPAGSEGSGGEEETGGEESGTAVPLSANPVALTVQAGTVPELPATVEVAYSDGSTEEVAVTWEDVDPADFAETGEIELSGTLEGIEGLTARATVTVTPAPETPAEPAIAGVVNPDGVTTVAGTAPELPATVEVRYDDKTSGSAPVTWEEVDPADYAQPGTFTVGGTVEGTDLPAEVTVTVEEAPAVPEGVEDVAVTTQAGTAPELPATVEVTWSDGDVTEEAVVWEDLDPSDYAEDGTFTVEGALANVEGVRVVATVTVVETPAEPAIAGVVNPDGVTTVAGTAPELPATVEVRYDDKTSGSAPVTWEEVDPADYAQPGTFTVGGTVEGTDLPAEVTVTVEEAPAVPEGVEDVAVTTQAGTAPELPATVEVTFDDGTAEQVDVAWAEIDPASYAHAGTFTVEGSLEGIDGLKARATVTVEALKATSIAPSSVETVAGTAPSLPQKVEVTWSDGSVTEESVAWEALDPTLYAQAGTFSVDGTVEGVSGLTATCTVNVAAPATPQSVDTPANVNTDAGVAPALPATVTVRYSDGSTQQHKVTWEAVDAASYHNGGSFTVKGTVDGTDLTTQVTVVVANAKVTGIQNNLAVQTKLGVAPALPETASVRWSNGDVTNEKVTWNAVDPSLYRKVGTFTVNGTVVGYSVPCTVTVVDQVVQTGDDTNMVPVVVGAVAGVAIVAAAVALIVRNRRNRG